MSKDEKFHDTIVDYITGKTVPNVGAEEIRQRVEQYLVEIKKYTRNDICVDADITMDIDGCHYASRLDLVVSVENKNIMVIKCAAGSLESREREVVSASRIYRSPSVPLAVVSDSRTAVIYDAVSGKKVGEGLSRIPSRSEAIEFLKEFKPSAFSDKKLEKEKIIFRSYDSMNVNVCRKQ